ncbi:hypothetical protein GE107_03375 [Cohnella sp. CFH 77786]|uniref:chemotaxis protein CheX n=1 Tax=Cohnella sp. CFH 77786 TaxID=2662265 RepID=UPI001C60AD0E|nr:chemotaxis protein CheX [Cohnella sp. CFH 77786]MBW5445105.1 hypothetical protein [Cohnella sp. CFH 77786]
MALDSKDGLPDLFPSLLAAAERYMEHLGLAGFRRLDAQESGPSELELEDVTAFIQVSGGIQGGYLLSVDHGLSCQLAKLFMVDEIDEEEASQYASEVVAEVANIVTAHSLKDHEDREILLGNPLMILSRDMGMRAGFYQSQTYAAPGGRCRLICIPKMDKTELASIVTVRTDGEER